ncbi:MAG: metal-sulfur cluster assembly factor [Candidatus Kerfeldbacteria bacterium]|nr:metal-sulfur cluster assembly factor [Candidatus Kerfeldbacteria bacterium]
MSMRDQVYQALQKCYDPELGLDVVSLGLIYDVTVDGPTVHVLMTLTTPGCPLVPYFRQDMETKINAATGCTTVVIDVTFDPPWNPDKISPEARQQLTMLRG